MDCVASSAFRILKRDTLDLMQRDRRDFAQIAFDAVAQATGMTTTTDAKRAAKGGAARKAALTPEQRSEVAKKAAAARWAKKADPGVA